MSDTVLVPAGVNTEYDQELLDFLKGRFDNGVIRGDDWAEPAKEATYLKELGLDAGGASRGTIEADGIKVIDYGFGPFKISGKIVGMGIEAELGVTIPFFGYKKLVKISGDLINGVEAGFDVFGVASGSIRVYLRGKDVMVTLKASVLGKTYTYDFKLFSI